MDALIAVTVFGGTFWLLCTLLLRWSDHTTHQPQATTDRPRTSRQVQLQVLDGGLLGDVHPPADDAPDRHERQISRSSGERIPASQRRSGPPATGPEHPGRRAGASSARSA